MKQSPIKLLIFYVLQFSWGLIQNIIGLLLFLFTNIIHPNTKRKIFHGCVVSYWKHKSSLSLGIFIFMGSNLDRLLAHEYGHSIQSLILGPLYLIVVGIPSFIWAMFYNNYRKKNNKKYFIFYTERWANELANIVLNTNIMEENV